MLGMIINGRLDEYIGAREEEKEEGK